MIPVAEWRPATPDDASAIVALQDACFAVDDTFREVESEIRERFEIPGMNADLDSLVAVMPEGDVLASIWSYVADTAETQWTGSSEIHIHPDYRTPEVEGFALDWWENRTTTRLLAKDDDLPKKLAHSVWGQQTDRLAFLEARGYRVERYFDELVRDLDAPIGSTDLSNGLRMLSIRDANPDDDRIVHNEAFRDHWGSQPLSRERWATFTNEFYLPDASYVVYDGDRPVAHVMSGCWPHDFEDRGWPHAWVLSLGVVESHRGMGIAKALLNRAMSDFKAMGMEKAVLDVDSENPTGAYALYEGVGFSRDRRTMSVAKPI